MSLRIDGLTVLYDGSPAVAALSVNIAAGERFAVMGPSGSGKSTLLRAIAGLAPMESGTIEIDGVDMASTPAHRRPVGLMFQDYALFPHMTVAQNVAYGLRMAGVPPDERKARSDTLLSLVGLEGFANRDPVTLSGGEQQRVALARTLAPEPSIVLLDEPLGSLDISLRESLLVETRAILASVGATSVYVTHDRAEAFAYCDRMAVMHKGEILRVGTPGDIWHDPGSRFVALAIGQSNILDMSALEPGLHGLGYVPLDAVVIHEHGRLSGIVTGSRFHDGTHIATLGISGGSSIDIRTRSAAVTGSHIAFDIDRDQVIVVSVDEG